MKMLKVLILGIAILSMPFAAAAQEYRMLSGWTQNYLGHSNIVPPFIKGVEAASKGKIKITLSGPETVPPFEQLQPTQAGAFQLLFTVGVYHFGTTPVLTVADALDGDMHRIRASGIVDMFDKHYQKLGLKLIAMPITADGGFHFILRQPIGPSGDLQGRKIRVTPNYSPVVKALNGVPTVLPVNDIYSAIEKGVVDGAVFPVIGALGYRWYEVAKYLMRPAFGTVAHEILMNLDAWNKLSEADRRILLEEGRKIEDAWVIESGRLAKEEEEALIAKGSTLTYVGATQRENLKSVFQAGLWDLAASKNPKEIGELRQFARSKKLAH